MAETYTDPFTAVYKAIRNGMLAWDGIVALLTDNRGNLRLGDFQDMSDPTYRRKPNTEDPNSFPEFMLFLGQFHMEPFANSQAAKFGQSYLLCASTEFFSIIKPGLIKIHTMAALANLGTDLGLPGLVYCWNITNGANEMNSFVRPHSGWTTLLSINVEMSIKRTDLLAI